MFYIDFTTPEGKTYRIDVSKNPVSYEYPVCGDITIYEFHPEDENCCASCVEQRRIQKEKEKQEQADKNLVDYINQAFRSNITIDDLNRAKANEGTFKEFLNKLKENFKKMQKKKWPDAVELPPNIRKLPPLKRPGNTEH